MQYGSIGWSVGATLGYAQAATDKRVIACIGDGSFQVSGYNDEQHSDYSGSAIHYKNDHHRMNLIAIEIFLTY